jgi:hypothetical protein
MRPKVIGASLFPIGAFFCRPAISLSPLRTASFGLHLLAESGFEAADNVHRTIRTFAVLRWDKD